MSTISVKASTILVKVATQSVEKVNEVSTEIVNTNQG